MERKSYEEIASAVKYQINGILGLPVLRALQEIGISATGGVRMRANEAARSPEPDLFFDELDVMAETRHAGGVVKLRTEVLPGLQLSVAERTAKISKVSVRSKQPSGQAGYRDGVFP